MSVRFLVWRWWSVRPRFTGQPQPVPERSRRAGAGARRTAHTVSQMGSSFNPRNHGTLAYVRKERPCLSSSFLDVAPSRSALTRAEAHGTIGTRVSWETRSGRFGLDAKLNKPPPSIAQRVWTSPHCPRAAPEHVNSLSQDHPRFPYHSRAGRFTDPGTAADTMQAAPRHFIAEQTSGTADLAAALPFPRSFQRGSSSGLKISPRFQPAPRKAYSARRNDVDPYKVLKNDWIRQPTRYQVPGSGNKQIAFGPTSLQRSPRAQQPHLAVNSGGHRDWTRRTNIASNM